MLHTYLGNLEQRFCDFNNAAQLLHIVDPVLDRVDVSLSGRHQQIPMPVDLSLGPFFIHWPSVMEHSPEDTQCRKQNDRFLIHDIVLIADRVHCQGSASRKDCRFRDQIGAGQ